MNATTVLPEATPAVPRHNAAVLGPWIIGCLLSMLYVLAASIPEIDDAHPPSRSLQGILLVQTNSYFGAFKKDALHTRSFVAFITLLNL
jgi:hypothetical protein